MKRKIIEMGTELLAIQMNHWIFIVLAVTILGLFNVERPYLGLWVLFGLVPVFLYIVRVKVHNFFLFFLLHFALFIAVFVIPAGLWIKLIMLTMVLIYAIWSIRIRLTSETSRTGLIVPLVAVIVIGALSLIQSTFIQKNWDKYYVLALFIYLICYFIYYFMSQYLHFLKVHATSTANIPEKAIFFSGIKQALFYTAGGMLVLLMTANIEWLSYVLSWLKQALIVVLRFLLSFMRGKEVEEITETIEQQAKPAEDMSGLMEGGETHIIWIILEKIVMAAMAVGVVVLIVFALVKGYQYLWKHFHKVRSKKVQEDTETLDIREKCEIEKNNGKAFSFLSFLNNRDKVRKVYRKQVLKYKSSIIGDLNSKELEFLTAKECCEKISADTLQAVYEKARYSEESVTADEVKLVKAKQI